MRGNGNSRNGIILTMAIALVVSGCSTKKDAFLNRTYHQLTARDNGWFNANELVKKVQSDMVLANPDNFDEVLPIFIYGTEEQAKTAYPDLDAAIEKCDVAIDRHSMRIKRKEVNQRIDENYITKGQANFYKHNYLEAERSFAYVSKRFKDADKQHVATIWLARTYGELDLLAKAQSALDIVKDEKELPKRFPHAEMSAVQADIYIKKGEVDNAIMELEHAVDITKKKDDRVRWSFILAQLYQMKGKTQEAIDQFARVGRMNPPYEIAFHCQIFQALASDRTADKKLIRARLNRMLKDDKHVDHYDMIHYALADIDLKENQKQDAIEHLITSCAVSTKDTKQKAKSYLKLADLYFDDRLYTSAQKYYDSTTTVLNKEHERYEEVENKANVLGDLVEQLDIIAFEDSVQNVAGMSEEDRQKFIRKLIKQKERDEEQRILNEEAAREVLAQENLTKSANKAPSGSWYFYDPAQIGRGMSDFRKRWGNRPLEDNWRRMDKGGSAVVDEEEIAAEEEGRPEEEDAPWKSTDFYLKDLPMNDSSLVASNERVCAALYRSGILYKEQLDDLDNAQESFEILIDRFDDDCTYTPESFYQKYRILIIKEQQENYFTLGETSEDVKRVILNRYPDSEFARLIENPDQLQADSLRRKEESDAYASMYGVFRSKGYGQVIQGTSQVINEQPENHLLPKYYMLRAMSIGGMRDMEGMRAALEELRTKFPDTEESKKAGELLATLNNIHGQSKTTETKTNTAEFKDSEAEHYYTVIFPKGEADLNTIKSRISDFNRKFFRTDNLKITASLLGDEWQVVLINLLPDQAKAMEYHTTFEQNKTDLKGVNDKGFDFFPITPDNYATLFKTKDVTTYRSYFKATY
jgi:tetratricopeptide (TPR) repeat protein